MTIKGDYGMPKKEPYDGSKFWDDWEKTMNKKQAQYNKSVTMNSGGECWHCLSLRE